MARPSADRRPPLRVVETRPRRRPRRPKAPLLSVTVIVGSLFAVVVGHAVLAAGQVRLSHEEARLAAEQAAHRTMELKTAQLETPSRVVAEAEQQLHMTPPGLVAQLPPVPLGVPVPTPRMYAAPATTTTTAPPTTTTTQPVSTTQPASTTQSASTGSQGTGSSSSNSASPASGR